jgi:hypothetical protein
MNNYLNNSNSFSANEKGKIRFYVTGEISLGPGICVSRLIPMALNCRMVKAKGNCVCKRPLLFSPHSKNTHTHTHKVVSMNSPSRLHGSLNEQKIAVEK